MTMSLAFSSVAWFGYNAGIAILDPTLHEYEDAYCGMYVKAVYFSGKFCSRTTWHRLKENVAGKLYFVKFGKRYYLDDMDNCSCPSFYEYERRL